MQGRVGNFAAGRTTAGLVWGGPSAPANAQNYPAKPVRVVVGLAPGGGTDIIARMVGQRLGASINQQVVIDNRPGAGGIVAGELTAHATADVYTMLMMWSSFPIQRRLKNALPYDTLADFTGVARLAA